MYVGIYLKYIKFEYRKKDRNTILEIVLKMYLEFHKSQRDMVTIFVKFYFSVFVIYNALGVHFS